MAFKAGVRPKAEWAAMIGGAVSISPMLCYPSRDGIPFALTWAAVEPSALYAIKLRTSASG